MRHVAAAPCSGWSDDRGTNHFLADCSAATGDGSTCVLTTDDGYDGGSVTCDLSVGNYTTVVASGP